MGGELGAKQCVQCQEEKGKSSFSKTQWRQSATYGRRCLSCTADRLGRQGQLDKADEMLKRVPLSREVLAARDADLPHGAPDDETASVATSAISIDSTMHLRERLDQRGINRRELQEAVKHGTRSVDETTGHVQFRHGGVVFVNDASGKVGLTAWAESAAAVAAEKLAATITAEIQASGPSEEQQLFDAWRARHPKDKRFANWFEWETAALEGKFTRGVWLDNQEFQAMMRRRMTSPIANGFPFMARRDQVVMRAVVEAERRGRKEIQGPLMDKVTLLDEMERTVRKGDRIATTSGLPNGTRQNMFGPGPSYAELAQRLRERIENFGLLAPGRDATITGLVRRQDLNGVSVTLLSFVEAAQRWGVSCDASGERVQVKPENLDWPRAVFGDPDFSHLAPQRSTR